MSEVILFKFALIDEILKKNTNLSFSICVTDQFLVDLYMKRFGEIASNLWDYFIIVIDLR